MNLLRLWFGFDAPVDRRAYVLTGFGLMAVKYVIEAALVFASLGLFWTPLQFLSPIYVVRMKVLQDGPAWLGIALALATLPFLWIGVTMSIRRAVDAGRSAWAGLAFLVPVLNFVVMLTLSLLPSKPGARWEKEPRAQAPAQPVDLALRSALLGLLAAIGLAVGVLGLSVYALKNYGATLFFATPFLMGAISAFVYNRREPQTVKRTLGVAVGGVLMACSAMLLFALEGVVCLAMALPFVAILAILGGLVGRAIALHTRAPLAQVAALVVFLPPLAGTEAFFHEPPVYEVRSVIEIEAPPEVVFSHVVGFSDLPAPAEWVFRTGVAFPLRAHIDGYGVGAVRRCEFTTGAFVEPITVWDEPRRLAFDVASQPPAMFEWSPFAAVHPPHLDNGLRSRRGEFRLEALPGGRTRLLGSTWYELAMWPSSYWRVYSDGLIHAIHQRVLRHVKQLSEAEGTRGLER